MQKIAWAILLFIVVLTGCANETVKEEPQIIQEEPKENIKKEEKKLPPFDAIEKPIITLNNQLGLASIYIEVCWIDCTEVTKSSHEFNHQEQVNIGDVINVKWDNMEPAPNKVEIKEYTKEFNQLGGTQTITDGQKNFQLDVTETSYDKQYEVMFIWEDNNIAVGKSMLVFPITK